MLNADDPRLRRLAGECGAEPLLFGLSADAAVRAETIEEAERGVDFELALPGQRAAVRLSAHGRFMVHNALAAAAAGHLLGVGMEDIKAGLEGFRPVPGRMSVSTLAGGVRLIDDTYNANPASMEAAIATLHRLRGARPRPARGGRHARARPGLRRAAPGHGPAGGPHGRLQAAGVRRFRGRGGVRRRRGRHGGGRHRHRLAGGHRRRPAEGARGRRLGAGQGLPLHGHGGHRQRPAAVGARSKVI
ncbi:MAG: Mur ligase family protein [Desulfobacterales bacterium]|nr:Mur ligase family protein [Desulfobacterales bacterium]